MDWIDFMLNEKGLIEFTNSFSRTKHEKHDKIIHRYKNNTKKIHCVDCNKYKKLLNPKILHIFQKTLVLFMICGKYLPT